MVRARWSGGMQRTRWLSVVLRRHRNDGAFVTGACWTARRALVVFGGGMQPQAERSNNLEDGREFWIASGGQRLVKAFATQARFPRDLRHSLGARDIAQRSSYQRGVPVFQRSFEIRCYLLIALQMLYRIPRFRSSLAHDNYHWQQ